LPVIRPSSDLSGGSFHTSLYHYYIIDIVGKVRTEGGRKLPGSQIQSLGTWNIDQKISQKWFL
jgi:hypothetical protein